MKQNDSSSEPELWVHLQLRKTLLHLLHGLFFLSIIDSIFVHVGASVCLKMVGDVISSRAATCCTQQADCGSQLV